jgi:type I restriction enzyme S subunit
MTTRPSCNTRRDSAKVGSAYELIEYRLGDIAAIQQGYTFSRDYQGQLEGRWPFVKVGDLDAHGNTKYLDRTKNYVDDDVVREIGATPFAAGSIVFPRVGAALRNNKKRILREACLTDDNVIVVTVTTPKICAAEYLYQWFDFHDLQRFCNDGTVPVINGGNLKRQLIYLPNLVVQQEIAELLAVWDVAIETAEQLIVAKEQYLACAISLLISRGRHSRVRIGMFAEEYVERNHGGSKARVLSVTNSQGFLLPEDRFERRVASTDLSNYKVIRRGYFAYNPSRINVGSIARLDDWEDGVLSPMYVVFKLDNGKVDSDYFLHWLNSYEARERIRKSAQGSVRDSVSYAEFAALSVPLPNRERQMAIASYLNALQEEIALLGSSVLKLKEQKRGLMQRFLTDQWRPPGSSQ